MKSPVHITKHTGKLEGMESIGTVCTCNEFCLERMKKNDSVCSHCYAERLAKLRKTMRVALEENYALLTTRVLDDEELPRIRNRQIFRFEAFGDLANAIQLENYVNIARKNKDTVFGLWTKNTWILQAYFANHKKPSNLRIVVSSPKLNVPMILPQTLAPIVDHIFTVYDAKTIASEAVNINCGGRKCADCKQCYKKSAFYINEKLK